MFDEIAPSHIRVLKAYQPGKPIEELERELGIEGAIKLASNENPLGPSPKAMAAAAAALHDVHFYPDGGCHQLRRAVADARSVDPEQLVFGAGSNELIGLIVHSLCRPGLDEVLTSKFAFISYRLAAMAHNVGFVESEVTDDLGCDVDALLAAVTERTKVVFLANPNNPTGSYLPTSEFERLLKSLPERIVLVVDEAYHEYAVRAADDYPSSQTYHQQRQRTVTLRTFSKIFGLAGLRVGYAIADSRICDLINRVRRPFNVTSVGQVAATAALGDEAHVEASAQAARHGIASLSEVAQSLGLRVYPSLGNFVLVDLARDVEPVYDQLLRRGVIVRPMKPWGLPTCVRVSVGTEAQTKRAGEAFAEVLA